MSRPLVTQLRRQSRSRISAEFEAADLIERLKLTISEWRDLHAKEAVRADCLREALTRIREHCADNDAENWIWRTAEQALKGEKA